MESDQMYNTSYGGRSSARERLRQDRSTRALRGMKSHCRTVRSESYAESSPLASSSYAEGESTSFRRISYSVSAPANRSCRRGGRPVQLSRDDGETGLITKVGEAGIRGGLEGRVIILSVIGDSGRTGGVNVEGGVDEGGKRRGEGDRTILRTTGEVKAARRSSAGGTWGEDGDGDDRDVEMLERNDHIRGGAGFGSFCHSASSTATKFSSSSSSSMTGISVGSSSESRLV